MSHAGVSEAHFTATDTVRDIVIGMSDGLTVPFALAAGISGAVAATGIVVVAGLAEIAAGSISMGLGGYLAARTELEHYRTERKREWNETKDVPATEREEVAEIFRSYGIREEVVGTVVDAVASDRNRWVDFMMRFELGLEEPRPRRAMQSAGTIGMSYAVGGMIPLAPYVLIHEIRPALLTSIAVTMLSLLVFGYVKARVTGTGRFRGALQTFLIGGIAATVAFALARLIS